MSAWVIGLGLAAGYLINKKMAIVGQLEKSAAEHYSGVKPATDGVTSAEVRSAWKRTDHVKYGDMNMDLSKKEMDVLVSGEERAASLVEDFDRAGQTPQIEGVLLRFDHLGV